MFTNQLARYAMRNQALMKQSARNMGGMPEGPGKQRNLNFKKVTSMTWCQLTDQYRFFNSLDSQLSIRVVDTRFESIV